MLSARVAIGRRRHQAFRLARRRETRFSAVACRGFALFEALVAMGLFAFGMLAMVRMESSMVAQFTEAQSRQTAALLASEHAASVVVDLGNADCYTLPSSNTCSDSAAQARTQAWGERVQAALPGATVPEAQLDSGAGRITIKLSWPGKGSGDLRSYEVVTDARP